MLMCSVVLCAYAYVRMYVSMYVSTYVCMYVYALIYVRLYACMDGRMHACVCVCLVPEYIHTCMYMYVLAHRLP